MIEPMIEQYQGNDRAYDRAIKAMIEPTLTYGAESWVLTGREKQRIQAAEMRVFRKIAGVRRMDHVRNDDIRHS